jgi:hypothetical protein
MREARYVSLIPRTTLHSDSEQLRYKNNTRKFNLSTGAAFEFKIKCSYVKLTFKSDFFICCCVDQRFN